ncbi:unnamed protein product [Malus baccata var. baccata]
MAAVSNSLALTGSSLIQPQQYLGSVALTNFSLTSKRIGKIQPPNSKRSISVQAAYSIFLFNQLISKALAGADRKDLMRKLPKFIYDEDKALEKTRKILAEKIAQLNSAIDDVSGQLRSEDDPDEVSVNSDEVEAVV